MNSDAHEMKVNIYPESPQKIIICIKPLSSLEARPLSNTNISGSLLWCNRQTEDSNHRSIKPDEVILYTGNRLVYSSWEIARSLSDHCLTPHSQIDPGTQGLPNKGLT